MNVVARGVRTTVVRAPEPGLDLVLIGANATLGKRNNTKICCKGASGEFIIVCRRIQGKPQTPFF